MAPVLGSLLEPESLRREKALCAAKFSVGRIGTLVAEESIQLHGGIGMTYEYAVGHYFKRLTAIDTLFGDMDHHLGLLAAAGGLMAEAA